MTSGPRPAGPPGPNSGFAGGRQLVRRVGSVSGATLISRILGYARDALVAYAFGGGDVTDTFYAAFRLPNLVRRILGEGPLTSAFVPLFTERLAKDRPEDARLLFRRVFGTLLAVLLALVVLGTLFAPWLTHLVAWGFKQDPEKFERTVALTRLLYPFLLFVCLAAVSAGALNALGHFFLPALAPAMLSVAEIGFVLLLASQWPDPLEGLAISAVAGGVLHFLILVPLMKKEGLRPGWAWAPKDPGVRQVGMAIVPAIWGLSVDQINAFLDTLCASFLASGSVTALYNSNRLMQFPLALFGIAASTAALPALSRSAARQDWADMKRTLNFSLRLVFFLILPAMVGLVVLGRPIVQLLFEHGQFTPRATGLTVAALSAYALGLPAFAGVKVVVSAFYSLKDTRTPVRVATYCLLINMAGNLALMWRWGVAGLAFATTLASTVNGLVLLWLLRRRLGLLGGRQLLASFARSALACGAMAAVCVGALHLTSGFLLWRLPLVIGLGVLTYAAAARALAMEEFQYVAGLARRRAARAAPSVAESPDPEP